MLAQAHNVVGIADGPGRCALPRHRPPFAAPMRVAKGPYCAVGPEAHGLPLRGALTPTEPGYMAAPAPR